MPLELVYQMHGRWVTFPLDRDEVTIGRDAQNDLVIEHRSISRIHAKLVRRGGSWRVLDQGSRYGTTINDIGHTEVDLRNGDKIFLHRFPLTFVQVTPASAV